MESLPLRSALWLAWLRLRVDFGGAISLRAFVGVRGHTRVAGRCPDSPRGRTPRLWRPLGHRRASILQPLRWPYVFPDQSARSVVPRHGSGVSISPTGSKVRAANSA